MKEIFIKTFKEEIIQLVKIGFGLVSLFNGISIFVISLRKGFLIIGSVKVNNFKYHLKDINLTYRCDSK